MNRFPRQLMHSSGMPMALDPNRLLLSFQRDINLGKLEPVLKEFHLALEGESRAEYIPHERVNNTRRRIWVRSDQPIESIDALENAASKLGLEWIGPVYRIAGTDGRRSLLSPLPNVLLVKTRETDDTTDRTMNRVAAAAGDDAAPLIEEVTEKSKYLGGYRYFVISDPKQLDAYQLRARLLESGAKAIVDVQFETMPFIVPTAVAPNDTLFAQQWDMTRIQAGGAGTTAWDTNTGAGVVVCVLDEGCDLTHPDLRFSTPGINLGTMMPDGAPTGNHGTACGGIAVATFGNSLGVAGVAGNARIMPVAFVSWTDAEVAAGINWATTNGADVISMSFGWNAWSHAVIDPAIQNAFNNDVVMAVATHNHNGAITYPATNPLVIACGASDQADNRKSPSSPDGEGWGSNFGPEISVVAPGVLIPTTDRQGSDGYNTSAGVAGDYAMTFNGTSSATPHVAGLAALIRSQYPALTNVQVRDIIERTAEKVGTVAYADTAGHPSGTWNQEMGYGRINAMRALDFADVMIKDAPGDSGAEPFAGGNFWDYSDVVVRINDDGIFVPGDPTKAKNVERGQSNYIYVQVTNNGPRDARNVTVSTRITPFVGTQFVFPQDWTLTDAMHVNPAPVLDTFASIPAGGTAMAKFRIDAAQTDVLYGWQSGSGWHACLLANVNADNDFAFATAPTTGDPISARRNNLAQRNLSVIDVLGGASAAFPFVAGNRFDGDRTMAITVDRSALPKGMPLLLSLDDDGSAFPQLDFDADDDADPGEGDGDGECGDSALVFLDKTRIQTKLGCCAGVLTLGKGSRFDCVRRRRLGKVTVKGGDVVLRGDRRFVDIREAQVTVQMEKAPHALVPLSLETRIPTGASSATQFTIKVSQQNAAGATVGGATMVYVVK